MSEFFRVSGKKVELPPAEAGWSFETRPGGWVVATRARAGGGVERRRFALHQSKGALSASFGGFLYYGRIEKAERGAASGGSDADLVAQFPGKVRKILVQDGAVVEEGAPLVLLEAMKMEFSIKAPSAGTVKKVLVKDGQQLSPGAKLVDFQALASGSAGATGAAAPADGKGAKKGGRT